MNLSSLLLLLVVVLGVYGELYCPSGESLILVRLSATDADFPPESTKWSLDNSLGVEIFSHDYSESAVLSRCFDDGVYNFSITNATASLEYHIESDEFFIATGTLLASNSTVFEINTLKTEITVNVTHDEYPLETSWALFVLEDSNFFSIKTSTATRESTWLVDGTYRFTIYDTWGDGLCCLYGQGGYSIGIGSEVFAEGGDFGTYEDVYFRLSNGEVEVISDSFLTFDPSGHVYTLTVSITADDYPYETEWTVLNMTDSQDADYILSGYASAGSSVSIGDGVYEFSIVDHYGDGICCDYGAGFYELLFEGDEFYYGDGTFDDEESMVFYVADGVVSFDPAAYNALYGTSYVIEEGATNEPLGPGAITAILFACTAFAGGAIWCLCRHQKRRTKNGFQMHDDPVEPVAPATNADMYQTGEY